MSGGADGMVKMYRSLAGIAPLRTFRTLRRHCGGATAIEYALLAALIALGISGAVLTLGGAVSLPFQDAADGLGAEVAEDDGD